MRHPADLVHLEHHNAGYGQPGAVSTVLWPNGTASAVSQSESALVVALLLARLEMEQ